MSKVILDAKDYLDLGSVANSVRILDSMLHNGNFKDSVGGVNGIITAQTLTVLSQEIFEFMPPASTYLSLGIKVDTTGGWGNYIQSLREEDWGEYLPTGNKSQPLGKIGVAGSDAMIKVTGYGAESNYTETDINQAKMENRNLRSKLYKVHGKKYFEKIDELGYGGLFDSDYERVDSTKLWEDMNNNEKLTFIYNLLSKQRVGKNPNYWADTVIVDNEMLTDISTTDYSSYKEGSMLNKLQQTWNVKFVGTFRSKEAGTADSRIILPICTNTIRTRIPLRLKFSPIHRKGFMYDFEGMFRTAGADIKEISGGLIGDKL